MQNHPTRIASFRFALLLVPFLLVSCTSNDFPEIDAFCDGFSYSKSVSTYKSAVLAYSCTLTVEGTITGTSKVDYTFDRHSSDEMSASYASVNTGTYATDISRQEVSVSALETDPVTYSKVTTTNGESEEATLSISEAESDLLGFYSSDADSDYRSGGLYYGDWLTKTSVSRYKNLMSIDKDSNSIVYEANNLLTEDDAGYKYLNSLKCVINQLGMLTYRTQSIQSVDPSGEDPDYHYSTFASTMEISYPDIPESL